VILPLDRVAADLGLAEADFSPPVWQAGIFNGQRFGIPLDVFPDGLFYNKRVFQDAGLDPNTPPRTGAEYLSVLEQLKAAGIQGSWVGAVDTWGGRRLETLLWQFGGDLYNEDTTETTFNSDAGVQALTWWVDLIRNGYSPENVAGEDIITAFQNNQNAFGFGGINASLALSAVQG
jgi:multiple sugar transport system substrate-binding protein